MNQATCLSEKININGGYKEQIPGEIPIQYRWPSLFREARERSGIPAAGGKDLEARNTLVIQLDMARV
jgi:hypothetical protein